MKVKERLRDCSREKEKTSAKCDSGLHHFRIKDTAGTMTEMQTGSHNQVASRTNPNILILVALLQYVGKMSS